MNILSFWLIRLRPYWFKIFLIFLTMTMSSWINVLVINNFKPIIQNNDLQKYILLNAFLILLRAFLIFLSTFFSEKVGLCLVKDVQLEMVDLFLKNTKEFIPASEIAARLNSDAWFFRNTIVRSFSMVRDLLDAISILAVVFFASKINLVFIPIFLVFLFLLFLVGQKVLSFTIIVQENIAKLSSLVTDCFESLHLLKNYHAAPDKKIKIQVAQLFNLNLNNSKRIGAVNLIFGFFVLILLLLLRIDLFRNFNLNIGLQVVALCQVYEPLRNLGQFYLLWQQGLAAAYRIFDLQKLVTSEGEELSEIVIDSPIFIRNLVMFWQDHFSSEINLVINPHTINYFSLADGQGKTSLAAILTGEKQNYKGIIVLGNYEWNQFPKGVLLKNISLVNKENNGKLKGKIVEVFPFIKENSTEMKEFLASFNWQSLIEGEVQNLPYTSRQLLMVLQAIYSNPQLLIFDDIFNIFSEKNKRQILEFLQEKKITTLVLFSGANI